MTAERLGYRPELDGLRGVAITLVLCLHWWPSVFPGGAIGVDLFFVLSGFLITRLLLEEQARSGRVDVAAFWRRRCRRLVPALAALLAVFWWVDGAWMAAVYVGNFGAISGAIGEPLRHTWSLAIEEQFYLVWPVAFLALARPPRRFVVAILLGGAVLICAHRTGYPAGARASFGTDTRTDGLLIGCALAFVWPFPAWVRWLAVPSTVWVTWVLFGGGGEWATWLVVAPMAGLLVASIGSVGMRQPWLVRLGKLSYSLYLWHYPITVLLRGGDIHGGSPMRTAMAIVLTTAAATGSWLVVERRWRPAVYWPIANHRTVAVAEPLVALSRMSENPLDVMLSARTTLRPFTVGSPKLTST